MIAILDLGVGNIGSVVNAYRRMQIPVTVVRNSTELDRAHKIILPGVGAFDSAMHQLLSRESLLDTLKQKVFTETVPILGLCLGMQLMTMSSAEGNVAGLGWVRASTFLLPANKLRKVPNFGWMSGDWHAESPLFQGIEPGARFYFAHSYYVGVPTDDSLVMSSIYGVTFAAALQVRNIFGVQFHPEKSHAAGLQILRNFSEL